MSGVIRAQNDEPDLRVYIIARNLVQHDVRRQLAIALKNMFPMTTFLRCPHDLNQTSPDNDILDDTASAEREWLMSRAGHNIKIHCSCSSCHCKIWKHIISYLDSQEWALVVDLSMLSIKDTVEIRPWLSNLPRTSLNRASQSLILFNESSSTYLINKAGATGLRLIQKGRHPEDYHMLVQSAVILQPPTSLSAWFLDAMGFEGLVTLMSNSLIQIEINPLYTLDLNYFHLLAIVVFVLNRMYLNLFIIDVLVAVELLMLLLLQ